MNAAPRRIFSGLLLPLALLAALPDFQWCTVTWAEVRPECFVACALPDPGESCDARGRCGRSVETRATASTCESPCRVPDLPSSSPAARTESPDPIRDSSARAWCLGEPAGPGRLDPTPSLDRPLTLPLANAVLEPEPGGSWTGTPRDAALAAPRSASPRARPPVRAPPRA